jgi:hypothetical protein
MIQWTADGRADRRRRHNHHPIPRKRGTPLLGRKRVPQNFISVRYRTLARYAHPVSRSAGSRGRRAAILYRRRSIRFGRKRYYMASPEGLRMLSHPHSRFH